MERKKSMQTEESIYGKISELVDEVKTFIIDGSETTSNLFTGMILHMFKRPDIVERLRKEITSVVKSDQDITV